MFNCSLRRSCIRTVGRRRIHHAVIVGAARTPVGSMMGSLSSFKASQLGGIAIKAAMERSGVAPEQVDEVIMGNVIAAGIGQAPAKQAATFGGLPSKVNCTTINKVCSSGMKAVTLACQSINLGYSFVSVAGGMESMSNAPYYLDGRARGGMRLGEGKLVDSIIFDGLTDAYDGIHMGVCAEKTAAKFNLTRQMQDEYAVKSYKRAAEALEKGHYRDETVPITVQGKKGEIKVTEDEEIKKVDFSKLLTLKPVFDKNGTITAANASKLNDGASAVVLTTADYARKHGLKPFAKIIAFADAETNPVDFPIAPSLAIPLALKRANLTIKDIDFWEINEAFSCVTLANIKQLNLPEEKVNTLGGGVSMGHAIGNSGCRMVVTMAYHLQRDGKRYGCAAICNGGGGATAVIIENMFHPK